MAFLQCSISVPDTCQFVVSPLLSGTPNDIQALVLRNTTKSTTLQPLLSNHARCGFDLGEEIELCRPPHRKGEGGGQDDDESTSPHFRAKAMQWDAYSRSMVLLGHDGGIARMCDDNVVHVEPNPQRPTPGCSTPIEHPTCMASDGAGSLYITSKSQVHRMQLPAGWRVQQPVGDDAARDGVAAAAAAATGNGGAAASPSAQEDQPLTTLMHTALADIGHLHFDASSRSLLYATGRAVFRLPLTGPSMPPDHPAVRVAGIERGGRPVGSGGGVTADGSVRFGDITGLVVDGRGDLLVFDERCKGQSQRHTAGKKVSRIVRVATDGATTTLLDQLDVPMYHPAILSSGCVACCRDSDQIRGRSTPEILLIDLGCKPLPCLGSATMAAAAMSAARHSLSSDLGTLLAQQPDGTADVTLLVGSRPFPAHRAILAARSPVLRACLSGGFSEGISKEVPLHDTDPSAFTHALHYMYTAGQVEGVPGEQVQAVAELADRLELPGLSRAMQARVLESVEVATVVDALLWVDSMGPAFSELRTDLSAWYLEHQDEIISRAPETLESLKKRPSLLLDLHLSTAKRVRVAVGDARPAPAIQQKATEADGAGSQVLTAAAKAAVMAEVTRLLELRGIDELVEVSDLRRRLARSGFPIPTGPLVTFLQWMSAQYDLELARGNVMPNIAYDEDSQMIGFL